MDILKHHYHILMTRSHIRITTHIKFINISLTILHVSAELYHPYWCINKNPIKTFTIKSRLHKIFFPKDAYDEGTGPNSLTHYILIHCIFKRKTSHSSFRFVIHSCLRYNSSETRLFLISKFKILFYSYYLTQELLIYSQHTQHASNCPLLYITYVTLSGLHGEFQLF
jgi:hypothetical protein